MMSKLSDRDIGGVSGAALLLTLTSGIAGIAISDACYAQGVSPTSISASLSYSSDRHLLNYGDTSSSLLLLHEIGGASLSLGIAVDDDGDAILEHSGISYDFGNVTLGFGNVERHWSFSDRTSLIMSGNAPSPTSFYVTAGQSTAPTWWPMSWIGPWSVEVFNAWTEGSDSPNGAMLLGMRFVASPIEGLELEFVRAAQWGGGSYDSGISGLIDAATANTNEGPSSHVNQLAGFGFSLSLPANGNGARIYGQAVGEDEAGGLPSCFMHMIGAEWSHLIAGRPVTIGIERVDTRIGRTGGGFCGPNTAYNNGAYKYTNDGTVMGAPIDTEGVSTTIFGEIELYQDLAFDFSIGSATINDANWSGHRLSTSRQEGAFGSVGVTWSMASTEVIAGVSFQDFELERADMPMGWSAHLSISTEF